PKAKKLYERLGFSTLKVNTVGKITKDAGFSKVYLMCKEI
ncbi:MAG TPA: N-acetyltransferase, partial [Clostridiales bacterium]|nr:N-acetyltransferase [Clostridiales bacterium]